MNTTIYITKSGTLSRRDNTLLFENNEIKKVIPIEGIDTIYLFGETSLNTKLLNFLAQKSIMLHVFNYYGFYSGSYYPKDKYVSGKLLIRQVQYYTDMTKRKRIAQLFVEGIGNNILYTLNHYAKHGTNIASAKKMIQKQVTKLDAAEDVSQILGIEGGIWDTFYRTFTKFLPQDFRMQTRTIRPPDNPINALISFGNSLVYTQILSQIYQTQLNPTISYLHEPSEKRFSLSLDLAEVFKPDLVYRTVFKMINKKMLTLKDFDKKKNYCLLNEQGRVKFVQEFDTKLNKAEMHPKLKRNASNKTRMRVECYKIIKHLMGEKEYCPYSLQIKA